MSGESVKQQDMARKILGNNNGVPIQQALGRLRLFSSTASTCTCSTQTTVTITRSSTLLCFLSHEELQGKISRLFVVLLYNTVQCNK